MCFANYYKLGKKYLQVLSQLGATGCRHWPCKGESKINTVLKFGSSLLYNPI